MSRIAGPMLKLIMPRMTSAWVLNASGLDESKALGIQAMAKAFLEELLWEV